MRTLKSGLAVLLLSLVSSLALAADYRLTIHNDTGYDIFYLYISPGASDEWEEDVLGDEVLASGEERSFNLAGYESPLFDVKAIDEDNDEYIFWDLNLRKQKTLRIKLDHLSN